jgi:hypothetical protein
MNNEPDEQPRRLETEQASTPTGAPFSEWLIRVAANMDRMAVDEDYRKSIAKGLS